MGYFSLLLHGLSIIYIEIFGNSCPGLCLIFVSFLKFFSCLLYTRGYNFMKKNRFQCKDKNDKKVCFLNDCKMILKVRMLSISIELQWNYDHYLFSFVFHSFITIATWKLPNFKFVFVTWQLFIAKKLAMVQYCLRMAIFFSTMDIHIKIALFLLTIEFELSPIWQQSRKWLRSNP